MAIFRCEKCNRKLKSASGYTLHQTKCCTDSPDVFGGNHARIVYKPFSTAKQCQQRDPSHPQGVWCLDIMNFHNQLKLIDPKAYFITSGEAVIKAQKLCSDLESACKITKKLVYILKAMRGGSKYLETQWENGMLLLKTKNQRASSRKSKLDMAKRASAHDREDEPDIEPEPDPESDSE